MDAPRMAATMIRDMSNDEVLILRTMWELKALGNRAVTLRDLASHLSSVPKTETTDRLGHLEARGLVIKTKGARDDLFALSPLGAAFARQFQDKELGDLTRVS
jgi:predicted MarR family transcription regulator